MDKGKFMCPLIAILLTYVHHSQSVAVTATSCSNNGECTHGNSECDTAKTQPTCKCSAGYREDSSDTSTCVKTPDAVTATSCTVNGDCTSHANSECDTAKTQKMCKCSVGYKEDLNDPSTCVKIPDADAACSVDGDCTGQHVTCDTAQNPHKCKCSDGYKEDSNDQTTCVKIPAVTDTTCSGGKTDCKVQHSECDNAQSTPKCKCSEGYKKDSTGGTTCVKIPAVLDTVCPGGNDDCTAANSVCVVAGNPAKCKCTDGFRQDTKDSTTCKKELGQACSDGECLTNAECDTTCKCSDEHIEKDGLCVVPSSTIKAGLSEMVMMMWVLCVIILKLF